MAEDKAYGVYIPAMVLRCSELSDGAKLLFGDIAALAKRDGYCFAGNAHFVKIKKCGLATISRWMEELKSNGFIVCEIDKSKGNARKIYLGAILKSDNTPSDLFPDLGIAILENENRVTEISPKTSIAIPKTDNTLSSNSRIPILINEVHKETINNTEVKETMKEKKNLAANAAPPEQLFETEQISKPVEPPRSETVAHTICVEIWMQFYKSESLILPSWKGKEGGAEGLALKEIIAAILPLAKDKIAEPAFVGKELDSLMIGTEPFDLSRLTAKSIANADYDILARQTCLIFCYILNASKKVDPFFTKNLKLRFLNSNLGSILKELKNGKPATTTAKPKGFVAPTADQHAEADRITSSPGYKPRF